MLCHIKNMHSAATFEDEVWKSVKERESVMRWSEAICWQLMWLRARDKSQASQGRQANVRQVTAEQLSQTKADFTTTCHFINADFAVYCAPFSSAGTVTNEVWK